MNTHNIIVIGASAGGFTALQQIVADLPADFSASIFVVWHMAADVRGVLPQVLNRANTVPAAHARDGEAIEPGRIYIAPPDHHLLLEHGRVRVTHGPKENRFRPAVDPLFRSAAYVYGSHVIGVILSGALDDGTAGLWMIKQRGGLAVVQDPEDAEVPSMPLNAIREVAVDRIVPTAGIARVLVQLSAEPSLEQPEFAMEHDQQTEVEIRIAAEDNALESGIMQFGELTPYTCPECHGVLSALKDGARVRFRCHTGHAFSADSLLAAVTEQVEESIWNAIRSIEESMLLLNHMGDHFAESHNTKLAALYFQKAQEASTRSHHLRAAVMSHEYLSNDSLLEQAEAMEQDKEYGDDE